jgi:low temperature requirement protein LtrA
MWEKVNKVQAQIIIGVIAVIGSFGLLYMLAFKEIPPNNKDVFNVMTSAVVSSSLTAFLGFLYTQSKTNQKPNQ